MIRNGIWIITLVVILSISSIDITVGNEPVHHYPLVNVKVDEFNAKDDWTVTFSRWRTPHFNSIDRTLTKGRERSGVWYDVFTVDDTLVNSALPRDAAEYVKKHVHTFLGVRARFDHKDMNWVSIEPAYSRIAGRPVNEANVSLQEDPSRQEFYDPTDFRTNPQEDSTEDTPYFIRLVGKTLRLEFFVWSSGKDYELEIHLEDYDGTVHVLPCGNLKYRGWKKFDIDIPDYIKQTHVIVPERRPLKFVRFKIIGNPNTNLEPAYWYFYYMNAVANPLVENYPGQYLEMHNKELWKEE